MELYLYYQTRISLFLFFLSFTYVSVYIFRIIGKAREESIADTLTIKDHLIGWFSITYMLTYLTCLIFL